MQSLFLFTTRAGRISRRRGRTATGFQYAGLWVAPALVGAWSRDPGRAAELVSGEHNTGEPSDDERHQRGGYAVQQAIVACSIGDILLKAGLDHLQRRCGAR